MELGMDQDSEHSNSTETHSLAVLARRSATEQQARRRDVLSTVRNAPASSQLVRLAARLDVSVNELLLSIPKDTVRRSHYPVIARPQEDGSIVYEHPVV